MDKKLLNTGIQDFIIKNLHADILSVSLKKSPFDAIPSSMLAQQIKGHQTLQGKVPSWYGKRNLLLPPSLNLEQTSSEITARYKASIASGKSLLDLTGGLGVDAFFLSEAFDKVYHCEQNESLSQMAANNFAVLGATNIKAIHTNGLDFLKIQPAQSLDWIYADPARRNEQKKKVIRLEDYEPNILEHLDTIRKTGQNFLLKTSPMLDIHEGIRQLDGLREIHMVAVDNEMRELLWWIQPEPETSLRLKAVNITSEGADRFEFTPESQQNAQAVIGSPETYLYEPNAALMKSGAFALIGQRYALRKLHTHTHLYTAGELLDFPGRRFRIEQVIPYKPGKLGVAKANISARNFPESVALIRKRNKIADGGDLYLFFVRLADESLAVLFTRKA